MSEDDTKKKKGLFAWFGRSKEKAEERPAESASPIAPSAPAAPLPTIEAPPVEECPIAPAPAPEAVPPEAPAPLPSPPLAEESPAPPEKKGWLSRLASGLKRSTSKIADGITGIFTKKKLDKATLEEFEELLIAADLGPEVAARVTAEVARGRYDKEIEAGEVRRVLADSIAAILAPVERPLSLDPEKKPFVLLVVGVNGTGKTTTIGKLAHLLKREGKSVMLAAGDTFRAAAIEQLKVWGERNAAPVIARAPGADAAGLAFDALKAAREAGMDALLIDTAGRLQNKAHLMDELAKIRRVLAKQDASAPHGVILVLDATTGQNAVNQVEIFREVAGVTGLVMTKLDGTARGGILVAIAEKFALPVHAIGVGEGIEDFETFTARDFAEALVGIERSG